MIVSRCQHETYLDLLDLNLTKVLFDHLKEFIILDFHHKIYIINCKTCAPTFSEGTRAPCDFCCSRKYRCFKVSLYGIVKCLDRGAEYDRMIDFFICWSCFEIFDKKYKPHKDENSALRVYAKVSPSLGKKLHKIYGIV